MHGVPDVLVHAERVVGAPDQAAAEEDRQKQHAVIPLELAAGHVELVAEPMDVEERGGKLVENEDRAIVVAEGSLHKSVQLAITIPAWGILTNPREKTHSAVTACARIPGPKILRYRALTTKSHRK